MLRVLLTSDYEIHGNGDGSARTLMVEPTDRMLALFERYGTRLTIMADVAEIRRFEEHDAASGRDDCSSAAVRDQLQRAVATGHDVQLHLHPSYVRAVRQGGRWAQDWSSYDFARLGYARMVALLREGKAYLETLLRSARPDYECVVFRAGNWAMQPSPDAVRALIEAGLRVDTSVFKFGRRDGAAQFDYSGAWSDVIPWPVSVADVCRRDADSGLFEAPIYAERRWVGAFLTPQRVYRAVVGRLHRVGGDGPPGGARTGLMTRAVRFLGFHAWKLDFNQCTGGQLIRGLRRAAAKVGDAPCDVPIVLIGHSKLFTRANARSLEPFLAFVADHGDRFAFGTFRDADFEAIRRAFHAPGARVAA